MDGDALADVAELMVDSDLLPRYAEQGYLFHGSANAFRVLEPRPPLDFDEASGQMLPDGPPAVCASADPDVAIFMAVMPTASSLSTRFYGFSRAADGRFQFVASHGSLEPGTDARGFVHVLEKEGFRPHGDDEWRSEGPVAPVAVAPVFARDLPPMTFIDPPNDYNPPPSSASPSADSKS